MANELNNRIKLLLNEKPLKNNNKILSAGNNIMSTKKNTDEVREMLGLNGGSVSRMMLKELKQFNKNKGKGLEQLEGGFMLPILGALVTKALPQIVRNFTGNGIVGGAMNIENLVAMSDTAEKNLKGSAVDTKLINELKQLEGKNGTNKLIGGKLPILSSVTLPVATMMATKILKNGLSGGSIFGSIGSLIDGLTGMGKCGGMMNDVVADESKDFDTDASPLDGGNILSSVGRYFLCDTPQRKKGTEALNRMKGNGDIAFANDMGSQRAFTLASLPKSKAVKDGVKRGGNFKNPETRQSTIRMGGNRLPTMEFSNANVTGNVEFVEPAGRQRGNVYGMKAKKIGGMRRGGADPDDEDPLPTPPIVKSESEYDVNEARIQIRMRKLLELQAELNRLNAKPYQTFKETKRLAEISKQIQELKSLLNLTASGRRRRGGANGDSDEEEDPLPPLPARKFDRIKDATMVADERRLALYKSRMARFIDLQRYVEYLERIGDTQSSDYTDATNEVNRLRGLIGKKPRTQGGALDDDFVLADKQQQGAGLFGNIGNLIGSITGMGKNKKVPKGHHIMPDGSVMKNSDHQGGSLFGNIGSLIDGLTGMGKKPRKQTPAMKKGTQALMAYQAKLKKLKSQGMTHKEAQAELRAMKE